MTERPEIFPGNPADAPAAPDIAPGDPDRIIAPGETPAEGPFDDPVEAPEMPTPVDPVLPPDGDPADLPPETMRSEPVA